MTDSQFTIELTQKSNYRFEARFDDPALPALVTDGSSSRSRGDGCQVA